MLLGVTRAGPVAFNSMVSGLTRLAESSLRCRCIDVGQYISLTVELTTPALPRPAVKGSDIALYTQRLLLYLWPAEEMKHEEEKHKRRGWARVAMALGRPFTKESSSTCRLRLQVWPPLGTLSGFAGWAGSAVPDVYSLSDKMWLGLPCGGEQLLAHAFISSMHPAACLALPVAISSTRRPAVCMGIHSLGRPSIPQRPAAALRTRAGHVHETFSAAHNHPMGARMGP
jgi:hypothetical protein